jgi:hypothetical protein
VGIVMCQKGWDFVFVLFIKKRTMFCVNSMCGFVIHLTLGLGKFHSETPSSVIK